MTVDTMHLPDSPVIFLLLLDPVQMTIKCSLCIVWLLLFFVVVVVLLQAVGDIRKTLERVFSYLGQLSLCMWLCV